MCKPRVQSCSHGETCPTGTTCERAYTGWCLPCTNPDRPTDVCAPDYGECVVTASIATCRALAYDACDRDADCRADEGASCVSGSCFGPRESRFDAGLGDSGSRDASTHD